MIVQYNYVLGEMPSRIEAKSATFSEKYMSTNLG